VGFGFYAGVSEKVSWIHGGSFRVGFYFGIVVGLLLVMYIGAH